MSPMPIELGRAFENVLAHAYFFAGMSCDTRLEGSDFLLLDANYIAYKRNSTRLFRKGHL